MFVVAVVFFVGFCSFFWDRCFYIATMALNPWNHLHLPDAGITGVLHWPQPSYFHLYLCGLPLDISAHVCLYTLCLLNWVGSAVCTATSLASCPSILHGGSLWSPFSLLLYVDLELDWFSCFLSVLHCSLVLMLSDAFVCVFGEQGPRSMELLEQRVCWYLH